MYEEELEYDMDKIPLSDEEEKKLRTKKEILDWVKTLVLYCFLPLAIFQSLCFMAAVPTGSMDPTIPVGSQVLTTRLYNKDNVERGDIIVFESDELGITLIKRCIGLPGDNLVFDGSGNLYINGELYDEPYVSSYSGFEGEFNVPKNCYFFCGDNRGGSHDCRTFNEPYIHKSVLKGKARIIVYPFSSFGWLE